MFVKEIKITGDKPEAFRNRGDIVYCNMNISDLGFFSWSKVEISLAFQLPIEDRENIIGILLHVCKDILRFRYDTPLSIQDEILHKFQYDKEMCFKEKILTKVNKDDTFCQFWWENHPQTDGGAS